MLTQRDMEKDQIDGLEQGADDYITKPFSSRVLVARIRARLRQPRSENYSFGEFFVDVDRAEVRKAGTPVPMTRLEFKLLVTFLKNSGKMLSRDRILDLVWGVNNFPTEHAVDNHIANLRRKIERDPQRPIFLVSIAGFGYRFEKNATDLNRI